MHSSRMRTGRSLTVCSRLLRGGAWSGGCLPGLGGSAWSGGSAPGGSVPRGVCLVRGGLPGLGGCLLQRGVCLVWGGISQHALRQTPLPPVDRQTPVKILPWPNFVAAGNERKNYFGNTKCLWKFLYDRDVIWSAGPGIVKIEY